jgi:hypothetical protein
MIGAVDKQQVIYDTDKQEVVGVIGSRQVLPEPEGDISLSPDGRWLVNGSRKDSRNRYTLIRRSDNAWVKSHEFDVTGWTSGATPRPAGIARAIKSSSRPSRMTRRNHDRCS